MTHRLRVAIECRIGNPWQGLGTAVLALARAFSESRVTDQEYTFVVRADMKPWLAPYIYGPCRLEGIPKPSESTFFKMRTATRRIAPLRRVWQKLNKANALDSIRASPLPVSDGYVETHGFDVVHFPTQSAYLTKLPTIYQPWDLQHLHYPQYFSKVECVSREKLYRAWCDQASYVCVQAQWTKQDLVNHYEIPEVKVIVIPWGSVFEAFAGPSVGKMRAVVEKYRLPDKFFFYPAVTWPHKNHEIIVRALSILRNEHHAAPHVVFTGSLTERQPIIERLARNLGISEQVHFLGFVTSEDLQAIFKSATAMVFPSKFEGFGLPILEAFHSGLPVLSSNVTTLPEVARDGALYFDPDSPAELAGLMTAILDTPGLREDLVRRGTEVLSRYSMSDTVTKFQALYEKTAAPKQLG